MWYSVNCGKKPGIYSTWKQCQSQVSGYKGAKFKKFESRQDAEYFLKTGLDPSLRTSTDSNLSKNKMYVYTDGSCVRRQGKILTGMGVFWGEDSEFNCGQNLSGVAMSNNQAELMAIRKALQTISGIIESNPSKKTKPIAIYTDSKYSIEAIENFPLKQHLPDYPNKELIKDTYQALMRIKTIGIEVHLHHIFAHSHRSDRHSIGNRHADKLAYTAAVS